MGKIYTALGLMSGTSVDGVDVSIIKSDGNKEFLLYLDWDNILLLQFMLCGNKFIIVDIYIIICAVFI